jgi:Protein of unknown function (DUF1579)
MKLLGIVGTLVMVAAVSFLGGRAWSGEGDEGGQAGGFDMSLTQPGPEHAHLKDLVGTWNVEGEMWMAPGEDPAKSTSTATFELMLGGRYLVQKVKGDPMMAGMPPFEGFGVSGYDRVAKHWFATWFDNMGTGVMLTTGQMSEDCKTLTLEGSGDFGMGEQAYREVQTMVSPTEFTFEMFVSQGGQPEMRVLRLRYTKS